jgi:uncharacterized hydrophobic protein (TIGR00271 family)
MTIATTAEDDRKIVRENICNSASFNFPYLLMNTLATIIACYGLFANSPAVTIGAMIIAMLLGPISGVALALVDNNLDLLKQALLALVGGIITVMLTALAIGFIHRDIPLTTEIIARTSPNLLDLMIALAGGAAGAYATVSPRLNVAFVGVAIATALVPPLAASSILLARGEYHLACGAFLLAFTNMVAIQFASSLVMWFTGFRHVSQLEQANIATFLKRNLLSILILAALAIALATNLQQAISKQVYENTIHQILLQEIETSTGSHVAEIRFETTVDRSIIRAVVRGTKSPTIDRIRAIETKLPLPSGKLTNELRIRFVRTIILSRDGLLYDDPEFTTGKL